MSTANDLPKIDLSTYANEPYTAVDLLKEARDILAATFWVRGEEMVIQDWEYIERLAKGNATEEGPVDLFAYVKASLKALILTPRSQDQALDEKWAEQPLVITGVCSIGAIALAYCSHNPQYSSREWGDIADYDRATRAAGEALAAVIRKNHLEQSEDEGWEPINIFTQAGTVIATWNDNLLDGDRSQVIQYFDEATAHPFATANELWTVETSLYNRIAGYVFLTRDEAQAFCDKIAAEYPAFDEWVKAFGEDIHSKPPQMSPEFNALRAMGGFNPGGYELTPTPIFINEDVVSEGDGGDDD